MSILGCGWLGRPLGHRLVQSGFMVSGSTTKGVNLDVIRSLGIKPFLLSFGPAINGVDYEDFFQADVLIISIPPRRKSGNGNAYLEQLKEVKRVAIEGGTKSIIFISSTSVYNDLNRVVVEDDADADGLMKTAEDIFVNEVLFRTTVIRFSGLLGPGRHPGRFYAGKETVGGDSPVNMIHLEDCIGIIQRIIDTDTWGHVVNACADLHPPRESFYTWAALDAGLPLPVFQPGAKQDYKIVSNEKLKKLLTYDFVFPDPMKMKFTPD